MPGPDLVKPGGVTGGTTGVGGVGGVGQVVAPEPEESVGVTRCWNSVSSGQLRS